MIQKRKLPGQRTKPLWLLFFCCGYRDYNWWHTCPGGAQPEGCMHFVWTAVPRATSSRLGARSTPSSSWPWAPPRAVAPCCFLVLARTEACTGIWPGPRNLPQSHQTLCTIQGPEVWARKRLMVQPQLQKLTQILLVIKKILGCWEGGGGGRGRKAISFAITSHMASVSGFVTY